MATVSKLSEAVLPRTSQQGRDVINHELDSLKHDWSTYCDSLSKTKSDLETCVKQWKVFEEGCDKCSVWLKEVEHKLRDVELKPTLAEKRTQLDRLRTLYAGEWFWIPHPKTSVSDR